MFEKKAGRVSPDGLERLIKPGKASEAAIDSSGETAGTTDQIFSRKKR